MSRKCIDIFKYRLNYWRRPRKHWNEGRHVWTLKLLKLKPRSLRNMINSLRLFAVKMSGSITGVLHTFTYLQANTSTVTQGDEDKPNNNRESDVTPVLHYSEGRSRTNLFWCGQHTDLQSWASSITLATNSKTKLSPFLQLNLLVLFRDFEQARLMTIFLSLCQCTESSAYLTLSREDCLWKEGNMFLYHVTLMAWGDVMMTDSWRLTFHSNYALPTAHYAFWGTWDKYSFCN